MADLFRERSPELERLDTGDYTQEEYSRWQTEMWFIHRIFGEARALRNSMIRDINAAGAEKISILDVGAGSGELLRIVSRWTKRSSPFLVGVELSELAARSVKDRSEGHGILSVRGDGLRLPFADGSFDYVYCSLLLHHLTEAAGIDLLREMRRVARRKFYVIDLHRHERAYNIFKEVGRYLLQPFTLEDGSLSILRSYTPRELTRLAEKAGLDEFEVSESRAYRLVLAAGKGSM